MTIRSDSSIHCPVHAILFMITIGILIYFPLNSIPWSNYGTYHGHGHHGHGHGHGTYHGQTMVHIYCTVLSFPHSKLDRDILTWNTNETISYLSNDL